MAEIVSLNQYRKARQHAKAASKASGNRARHGRSKSEKQREMVKRDLQAKVHDGKCLDRHEIPPDTD